MINFPPQQEPKGFLFQLFLAFPPTTGQGAVGFVTEPLRIGQRRHRNTDTVAIPMQERYPSEVTDRYYFIYNCK